MKKENGLRRHWRRMVSSMIAQGMPATTLSCFLLKTMSYCFFTRLAPMFRDGLAG